MDLLKTLENSPAPKRILIWVPIQRELIQVTWDGLKKSIKSRATINKQHQSKIEKGCQVTILNGKSLAYPTKSKTHSLVGFISKKPCIKLCYNLNMQQNIYLFPACISSKASLICSKGRVWVTNSSTFIFLDMYSATNFGILSTLFQPDMK